MNWRVPKAFYFAEQRDMQAVAKPCGGYINRKAPEAADECACFQESLRKP